MKDKPLKPGDILVSTEEYLKEHEEHAVWMVDRVDCNVFYVTLEISSRQNEFNPQHWKYSDFQPGYKYIFNIENYPIMFANIS